MPHAGFGLGFERTIAYVTGLSNVRDAIPFPRTPGPAIAVKRAPRIRSKGRVAASLAGNRKSNSKACVARYGRVKSSCTICPQASKMAVEELPMAITVCPVTPSFVAEIGDIDLSRPLEPADLVAIKDAFTTYAVLIFPDQHLSQDQHLDFAKTIGPLETTIALFRKDTKLRVRKEFADVSNLDPDNAVWGENSRQRLFQLGNRLWHTDSSFKRLPARASLLYARSIPPIGGHTEFADERAAYEALPENMKRRLQGLVAEHSIFNSRARLGFTEFSDEERQGMPPVPQALVAYHPGIRSQIALPRLPCRSHLWHARAGRTRANRRAHRPCHSAAVRLHASLARQRPGYLGQSLHHAPRLRVRRPALETRHAARHGV